MKLQDLHDATREQIRDLLASEDAYWHDWDVATMQDLRERAAIHIRRRDGAGSFRFSREPAKLRQELIWANYAEDVDGCFSDEECFAQGFAPLETSTLIRLYCRAVEGG